MIKTLIALIALLSVMYFTVYGVTSKLIFTVFPQLYIEANRIFDKQLSLEEFGEVVEDTCSTIARWSCLIISIIAFIMVAF